MVAMCHFWALVTAVSPAIPYSSPATTSSPPLVQRSTTVLVIVFQIHTHPVPVEISQDLFPSALLCSGHSPTTSSEVTPPLLLPHFFSVL